MVLIEKELATTEERAGIGDNTQRCKGETLGAPRHGDTLVFFRQVPEC